MSNHLSPSDSNKFSTLQCSWSLAELILDQIRQVHFPFLRQLQLLRSVFASKSCCTKKIGNHGVNKNIMLAKGASVKSIYSCFPKSPYPSEFFEFLDVQVVTSQPFFSKTLMVIQLMNPDLTCQISHRGLDKSCTSLKTNGCRALEKVTGPFKNCNFSYLC